MKIKQKVKEKDLNREARLLQEARQKGEIENQRKGVKEVKLQKVVVLEAEVVLQGEKPHIENQKKQIINPKEKEVIPLRLLQGLLHQKLREKRNLQDDIQRKVAVQIHEVDQKLRKEEEIKKIENRK